MIEIVELLRRETVVIERPGGSETVVVEQPPRLEMVEVAMQGPPGVSGTATFDDDIALFYQIAKL